MRHRTIFSVNTIIFIQKNEEKQRLEERKVPKKEVMEFFKENKIEKQNWLNSQSEKKEEKLRKDEHFRHNLKCSGLRLAFW